MIPTVIPTAIPTAIPSFNAIPALATVLLFLAPAAQAQDPKTFRAYEQGDVHLMVDVDPESDPLLGRVLHVMVSEGEQASRIRCDRLVALESPAPTQGHSFESCSGEKFLLVHAEGLRTENRVQGFVLNSSGKAIRKVEFELKYTQDGIHENGRDDSF
jgi:hypothetical protein